MLASTDNEIGSSNQRIVLASIIGITVLGFYLRYRCLGCLGFRWDEDLTALAVKALLEKGVPELPSGMIYYRFYPFQWIVAAFVKTFGFSEFSMRLPAVIFGTALIPTAYWITQKLFTKQLGLLVAACIALSFWQVEMARTARMYAPFFLVYILAAYAIYRAHFQNPERIFSPWVLPLALAALSIHQLAYSLAIILLLAIPLHQSSIRTASLLLQAAIIGFAFIAVKSIQQRFFDIPLRTAESMGASQSTENSSQQFAALFQQISIPDFALMLETYGAHPAMFLLCLAMVLVFASFVIRIAWIQGNSYRALAVVAIGLSVVHQFNLVAVVLVLMLILLKEGTKGIRHPAWYWPAFCCIAVSFLWLIAIAVMSFQADTEVADTGSRKLLRALVDYPNFRLFWSYVLERPLLSLPLALGTLWGIDRIASKRPDPTALFLVGSFWLVLFVNGVLETKFEFFRYNLNLDPLFLMLVGAGLFAIPDLLTKFGLSFPDVLKQYSASPVWTPTLVAIAIVGVNPFAAVLASTRDYAETEFPYTSLGLASYQDFKTPAAYVSTRLQDDDIILVLDPREYWNYIGRVDYWIRTSNFESQAFEKRGRAFDRYLGIPLLHSISDVKTVVAGRNSKNVWILFSRNRLSQTPWVAPDLKIYLDSLDEHIVYVGRDQQTVVIRITGLAPII